MLWTAEKHHKSFNIGNSFNPLELYKYIVILMYRHFRFFCSGETMTSASLLQIIQKKITGYHTFSPELKKGTSNLSAKFQDKIHEHVVFKCDQTTEYVLFIHKRNYC